MKKPTLEQHQIFAGLIAAEAAIYKELTALVGSDAEKAVATIRQHAIASAACGAAVIVPGADILAFVANTWTMYARINNALGISIGKNILKSIATAVGTNVISIIPGMAIGSLVGSLAKFIPGPGTVVGAVASGTTFYALSTVMGWIYLKGITTLVASNQAIDGDSLKAATQAASKDKAFVKDVFDSAKSEHEKCNEEV